MTTKARKSTTPTDPVTYEPPTVEIAGRTYTMRRLGLRDALTVARILGKGLTQLRETAGSTDAATIVAVLVETLVEEETTVLTFLASTIGVTVKELNDPDRFPLDSVFTLVEALGEHQDLTAFLARSTALAAKATANQ